MKYLMLLLVVTLVACGSSQTTEDSAPVEAPAATAPAETPGDEAEKPRKFDPRLSTFEYPLRGLCVRDRGAEGNLRDGIYGRLARRGERTDRLALAWKELLGGLLGEHDRTAGRRGLSGCRTGSDWLWKVFEA